MLSSGLDMKVESDEGRPGRWGDEQSEKVEREQGKSDAEPARRRREAPSELPIISESGIADRECRASPGVTAFGDRGKYK